MRRLGTVVVILGLLFASACSTGTQEAAPATPVPESVTLLTAHAEFGDYLTDESGRALYMWDADREGVSTCYGECAVEWPPLTVSAAATAGPGVDSALLGTVTRRDGTQQVTYGGWPLYYFEPDVSPGQLTGQGDPGFGAVWWVVAPNGSPLPSS